MKKLYLLIILLLLPVSAQAATYNVGPGRDYETLAAFSAAVPNPAPGDVIDGWGNTFNEKWVPAITGASGNHVIIYNMAISCGGGARNYALDISASDYITLLDVNITGACTSHGIMGTYDYFTGDALHGLRVENVESSGHTGSGISLTTWFASRKIEGVGIYDSSFNDNGAAGLSVSGQVDGVDIARTHTDGNGAVTALGGMYFGARTTHVYAGWTDMGGGIYRRYIKTDDANRGNVYRCVDATGEVDLAENTATPTTPEAGEWGFVDATDMLYIHLAADTDPVGRDIAYAFTKCTNITVDLSSTTNQQRPASAEGHGFMADDWSDNVTVTRHISYGNSGSGYTFNRATGSSIDYAVGYNNGGDGGWFGQYSSGNTASHLTMFDNVYSGFYMFVPNDSNSITDSIMSDNGTYGIASDGTPTSYTINHNLTYGNASGHVSNVTNSDGIIADPLLDNQGRPTAKSPGNEAGTFTFDGQKYAGKYPAIGAYDYNSGILIPWNIALSISGGPTGLGGGGRTYESIIDYLFFSTDQLFFGADAIHF